MSKRTRAAAAALALATAATVTAGVTSAAPAGADEQTYGAVAVAADANGPGTYVYDLAVGADGHVVTATPLGGKRSSYLAITDVRGTTAVGTRQGFNSEQSDIVTIDLLTGAVKVIAHQGFSPVLSYNGQKVLYVKQSFSSKPGVQPILRVSVNGGTPQKLLSPPKGRNFESLGTAQDGHTVYTTASTPLQGGTEADFARLKPPLLYSFNAGAPKLTKVALKQPLFGVGCATIVVDLSGKHVALSCNITQGDDPAVDIVTPGTGAVHQVPRKVGARTVTAWSPDGQWVFDYRANATTADPFDLAQPFGTAHHKLTGLPSTTLLNSVTLVRPGATLQPLTR